MKKAFTLAEVLITLGIIGVVAAMTIPTLISNINSAKYRSQFKKSISVVNQAVRTNLANYDYDFSGIRFDQFSDCKSEHPEAVSTYCAIMNANLKSAIVGNISIYDFLEKNRLWGVNRDFYLPEVEDIENFYFDGDFAEWIAVILPDNSIIFSNMYEACSLPQGQTYLLEDMLRDDDFNSWCIGFIDVNGAAKPNKIVKCSNEDTLLTPSKPCIVNEKDMADIFPIVFHDATVEPATNAAAYVLKTAK